MTNPDYAIQFNDLSVLDFIHVHTRLRFTTDQLRVLGNIPGITRFSAGDGCSYMTNINAQMAGHCDNSMSVGRLFTFEELAPQILWVFADALGVEVEDMTVTTARNIGRIDIKDGDWIVQAARKLRPKPVLHNPVAPFAATLDDMNPGTEILSVHFEQAYMRVDVATVKDGPTACSPIMGNTMHVYVNEDHSERLLSDMGVMPYIDGSWSSMAMTIVNTPENRRLLVDWLMERANISARNVAFEIVKQYVTDFVTLDTSHLPKGFGIAVIA